MAGSSVSADIIVLYENDDLAGSSASANTDMVDVNATATALVAPAMNTNGGWLDALTVIQNNAGINTLATAISNDQYFSFTVTPNSGFSASFSSMDVLFSLGANVQPAETQFSLLSSITGFTDTAAIDTFSGSAPASGLNAGSGSFDISGTSALQNVAGGGPAIEFRIYAHNTGANSMTRIGIGEGFATNGNSDLVLNGTIAAVPEPSSISLLGIGLVAFLRRRRV